jgi:structure-specific recognition protein 1
LAGKNEVAVEFSLPANGDDTGTNGALGGARGKGKKAGAGKDQLVEMRFYIPGVTTKKETLEGEDAPSDAEAAEEEQNAANLFYDTLMEKAEIGEVAGDTFATFLDVLHLTPRFVLPLMFFGMVLIVSRGRFDIDMYETSFRLRGKTYDYKIQYENIKKFMILPKPDELHFMICIGLDPPLRQGQTRYPFLVMQFKKDEEVTIDLNMTEELMKEKYDGKLLPHYEQPLHQVVTQVFRGLAGKKVNQPAKDFLRYVQMITTIPKILLTFAVTTASTVSSVQSRPAKVSCIVSRRHSCSFPSQLHILLTTKLEASHSPVLEVLSPHPEHST